MSNSLNEMAAALKADTAKSPLAEAKIESLDELMSRFPPSDEDIDKIILHLREGRRQWQQDEALGAKRAKKTVTGISLNDLGLLK